MPRAIIYIRVSSDQQDPGNQLPALVRLAEARGYEYTVREETESAAKARPVWQGVMDACHRGEATAVIVWALDRCSRSMLGMLGLVVELDRWGVQLISHQEPWLDAPGPTRPLLVGIAGWVAEQERARIKSRTRAGMARSRAAGQRMGRPAVHVDLDRALKLRAQGKGLRAVAGALGVGVGTLQRALAAERSKRVVEKRQTVAVVSARLDATRSALT